VSALDREAAAAARDDEDELDREDHGDPAEVVVVTLAWSLADRGPGAVRQVRLFAQALEQMADAAMGRDHAGLEDSAAIAHEALAKLMG
jgi:hypothetical protein